MADAPTDVTGVAAPLRLLPVPAPLRLHANVHSLLLLLHPDSPRFAGEEGCSPLLPSLSCVYHERRPLARHANPCSTRPNTLDTRLTTESRLPGNLNFPSVPNATNTVNDLLFLLEAKEEPLFAREKQRKKYQLSAPLRLSDTTVGRTGHL